MTVHDTFAGAQFVTSIADRALSRGITLQVGSDFEAYARIVSECRAHQPLGDPFNPEKQRVDHDNGFWIAGWNQDGELVHTQAMRRFQINASLGEYLARNFRSFPPAGLPLDLDRSRYMPGPGARGIRGSCCYHGEAWLMGGEKGYRGTGLAGALARFAMATAVLRWSPDYIFGFMSEGHAFRGLAEREGYMHTDPGALFWHLPDSSEVIRGFIVWMGREDLAHMIGLPAELLVA